MKYLKTHKIFESGYINQKSNPLELDVVNDIHDMLLDLKDEGINYVLAISARVNKDYDYEWCGWDHISKPGYKTGVINLANPNLQICSIKVDCGIKGASNMKVIKEVFERLMNYCDGNGLKYNLWVCPSDSRSVGRYCIKGQSVEQDVDLEKGIYENNRLEIFIFDR